MNKKNSSDSEVSNFSSDFEEEEVNTNEQTHENEKESYDENSQFPNIYLIKAISQTLETILVDNQNRPNYKSSLKKQSKMIFTAKKIPNISIEDYLKRIQMYSNMEKSTLIISLIYIDRFCNKAKITLTHYNIHRILFSSILIGIKFNEDNFYDNKYYAQIAGVKVKELKILEYHFIKLLNCELFVGRDLYDKYEVYLKNFNYGDD